MATHRAKLPRRRFREVLVALFGEAWTLERRRRRRYLIAAFLCCVVAAGVVFGASGNGNGPSPAGVPVLNLEASLSHVGGVPPVPSYGHGDRAALSYVNRASIGFLENHKTCLHRDLARQRHSPDNGSPNQAMLSRFAVLTLPNRTTGRLPAAGLMSRFKVYAGYVHVAQRRFGSAFEVIPVANMRTGLSGRCLAQEESAVRASIKRAPARIQATALQIERVQELDDRYIDQHPWGICVFGGGGGDCGSFLYAQARGTIQSGGGSGTPTLYVDLVPNGVTKITARFPTEGPSTGYARQWRGTTVTVPVINNLAIWQMHNEPGDNFPTVIWHAADGQAIRTIAQS
jgi:hypothetical protein